MQGKQKIKGRCTSIWLNEDEEKLLREKAEKGGVKLGALLKAAALEYELKPARKTSKADPKLLAALARIGNNLNQLSRAANKNQAIDPFALELIKKELEALKG